MNIRWLSWVVLFCCISPSAYGQVEENGLYGQYYLGGNFRTAAQARIDATINFNWSDEGPFQESMDEDLRERNNNFRVRWSGYITPNYTETYTFATRSDDGIRVWVDDRLVIDNWTNHAPRFDYGVIQLVEGVPYPLMIEYFQGGGGAVLDFYWQSESQPFELVPTTSLNPVPVTAFPTTVHLRSLNTWTIEGSSAGTAVSVYRRGAFDERVNVPIYIEQQSDGPPLRYNNLRARNDHWEVSLSPGESTTSFTIIGIEDDRETGPSELLVRMGDVAGYSSASNNVTRLVISDNEMVAPSDIFSASGTILATGTNDTFWTVAAFATDEESDEPSSITVLPGSGSFILEGLKAGNYDVQAWLDENEDGLLGDDEIVLTDADGALGTRVEVPPSNATLFFTDAFQTTDEQLEEELPQTDDMEAPPSEDAVATEPVDNDVAKGGCNFNGHDSMADPFVWAILFSVIGLIRRERSR